MDPKTARAESLALVTGDLFGTGKPSLDTRASQHTCRPVGAMLLCYGETMSS